MCLSYRSGRCKTALWLLWAALWLGLDSGTAIAQTSRDGQIRAQQPYTESLFAGGVAENHQSYTVLYVNPNSGRDDTGTGETSAPFRSITHALSVAEANTVIALAPGTYSEASGETFPLRLKSNVTIQGSRTSHGQNIIIQGGGLFISPTFARQNVTLLGASQAGLMGVTVTNPNPRGYGLWIESTSPVVLDNTFRGSTHDGISVTGDGQPIVQNNHFIQNGASGISFFGRSQGQVENNVFENTGFGVNIAQNATPVIANNRIVQNRVGVVVQANARPILRNNVIEANREDGLTAIANALPDLGTAAQPGGNIFRNNGRLDINAEATKQLIPVYGSQFASEATRGSLDLAGNPIAAPPPEEPPRATLVAAARSAAVTRSNNARAATPSAAQNSISAQSFPVPSSLQSTRSQPEAARGSAIAIPPTAPSTALPSPPQPQPQTRPISEARPIETSNNPATLQPPGQLSVQPQPALAQPDSSSTEVPVSQSPRSTGSVSDLLARSPVQASAPPVPQAATPTPIAVPQVETPASRAERILADRRSRRQTAPQPQEGAIAVPTPDAPISIPVSPPPQGSAPSPSSQPALSLPGDILPVPSAPIPVGSGSGGLPSVAISRTTSSEGPPPPPSRAGILGLRYRVIVEARTEAEQNQVRSLVPDAFRTQYQGQVFMQAGAYRDRAEADQMIELLTHNGLKTILEESD